MLDRLLPDAGDVLSPGGTFLLLLLEQNKPMEVAALLEAQGLTCTIMAGGRGGEQGERVTTAARLFLDCLVFSDKSGMSHA